MLNKYKTNTKEKKYKELNDESTTKQEQSIQNHQLELNDQGILNQNASQKEKDKERLVNLERQSSLNLTSLSSLSPRQYIIKTDNFEIWTTSTTKCISYHGLPYYSINKPKGDQFNFYIFLSKQGQYILNDNEHGEFKLDSFISSINSLVDSKELIRLLRKYDLMRVLTFILYVSVFVYLSIFSFYFFYSLILLMLHIPPELSPINIAIGVLFVVNVTILIVLLQVSKILEEKKACATFRHMQMRKNHLQNEINEWNLKTFSLINMQASLAENFDYIHIKYQIEANYSG